MPEVLNSTGLAPWASDPARTRGRRHPEPPAPTRNAFQRDRDRIVHSTAFRRLEYKTQVFVNHEGDLFRTRLTHSLEVAQVGRELAASLGLDPDVVDTACLAHDLGHPPFGHNGEDELNRIADRIGGFEGNAQTLRLLTRIEQKEVDASGNSVGLNLTRASLDAACKYPWSLSQASADTGADHSIKFGVYDDDLPIFNWMRIGAPERRKSVEAQVMDFADDVAYSVHDFEDAIVSGYIDVALLNDKAFEWELIQKISEWNGFSIASDELREALFNLQSEQHWIRGYSASPRDFGQLKNLTSALIGRFVSRTTQAIVDTSPADSLARFGALLVVPSSVRAEIAVLKGIVSALNRTIQVSSAAAPDNSSGGGLQFWNNNSSAPAVNLDVIQTDAAINPGNSGGALVNDHGQLIGVNVAIASAGSSGSGSIGVGFAIPSNVAKRIADEIMKSGHASHALLGAMVSDATNSTANASFTVGAKVVKLTSGGAAEVGGVKVGDVIVKLGDKTVTSASELMAAVRQLPAGTKTAVEVVRDGKNVTLQVTLGDAAGLK